MGDFLIGILIEAVLVKIISIMTITKFQPRKAFRTNTFFPMAFENIFNDLMSDVTERTDNHFIPKAEVKETEKNFTINLLLAGMDKNDVNIDIQENELVISGERSTEKSESNEKFHLREFHTGSFKRSFYLPDTADSENISAQLDKGILSVVIPKREKALRKQISIT